MTDRLLPATGKRARELGRKLDRPAERNGYRIFVSSCASAMLHAKGPSQRNAEVALVDAVTRWNSQVSKLLPDRIDDLRRIVSEGLANPQPPVNARS